jgi:hypothetical protein
MPKRKTLLPVTTGIAEPAFQMSRDAWARVEKKYRNKIPGPIRNRIKKATSTIFGSDKWRSSLSH